MIPSHAPGETLEHYGERLDEDRRLDAYRKDEAPSDSVAPDQEMSVRRATPPASPAVRKRAVCSPAYTIDARGVRHYKPECL